MKELSLNDKQRVSLEILRYFVSFCNDHGIRYYLAYGTLIGAIRHKGFIPWDDDVDILVPRPDYNKLLQEFVDTEEYQLISCYSTKGYFLPYAKIQNKKTKMVLPSGKIIDQGIGIDLFPLDGIPNELDVQTAKRKFEKENNIFVRYILRIIAFKFVSPRTAKDYIKVLLSQLADKTCILQKIAQRISNNPYDSNYDECKQVAAVIGIHSGIFRPFQYDWFKPVMVEFEGESFTVPSGYHEILTKIYHNYMEIPREEERISTHIAKYIWND